MYNEYKYIKYFIQKSKTIYKKIFNKEANLIAV